MPMFAYEAVTAQGRKVSGVHRAPTKQSAIQELREKGFMVRSVQEKSDKLMNREITFGRAVKLEHFVLFCRQFAILIRSGIQIDQALGILEDQTTSRNLKSALGDVTEKVLTGLPLSKAMGDHPKIFPDMFVNMIAAGESGGSLDDVLERMADHYEKEYRTVQKVKSAMTYPLIILVLAIGVVIFLLVSIVPTFATMFEEQGAEMPMITRAVMGISGFVTAYWWAMLLALIAAAAAARVALGREEGKLWLDKAKFRLPLFGPVFRKAAVARLSRTLSSLYTGGVPVLEAVDITGKVVGNRVLAKVMEDAKESLAQGKQLSDPFGRSGLFPKMAVSMLIVGEETGQVDRMLLKVAVFFESDVDATVDRLKAIIEPVMLLIVSGIVGVIVSAILSPMFSIYDTYLQ